MIDPPPPVINALVVSRLERIGAKIKQLRETQWHEGILPDVQPGRALFREDDFVLVVSSVEEWHALTGRLSDSATAVNLTSR